MGEFAEATWTATGLEGRVDQPEIAITLGVEDEFGSELSECLARAGFLGYGYGGGPSGGLVLSTDSLYLAEPASDEEVQLAFYTCVVSTLPDPRPEGQLMSAEEQAYENHHQTMHVVPCLRGHGHPVQWQGSGAFSGPRFSAFDFIRDGSNDLEVEQLVRIYGPEFAVDL